MFFNRSISKSVIPLVFALVLVLVDGHRPVRHLLSSRALSSIPQTQAQSAVAAYPPGPFGPNNIPPPRCDHLDWRYRNGEYIRDQQDHFRFHCYLAMAAFGNFAATCPQTFTQGFRVLQTFSRGFIARIEEMKKVVIVFQDIKRKYYGNVDLNPVPVSGFIKNCSDCLVAAGIVQRYLDVKRETNGFAVAKAEVRASANTSNPMLFSVTGAGWGGALAALCGLDLGSTNDVHYAHNSGTPRFMNYAAVARYDDLFQLLAGQSVVSRNDFAVNFVPYGNFTHLGQKVRIWGEKSQWYVNCFGCNENATCLGDGSSEDDHYNYFTPAGYCGSADKGF
ncbi:hypothetical protein O181_070543 [Austropuccinia psidii MF-1]|uniref:Fungal lipase-like domain-containing protein n=1 Tax=Austropuccinia psidii MF-1 TaxID=1389203 RepID=A0A9Q3I7C9_9BASI|nr:hypothetical protein [Austropuccinia psidii MF-1]